MCYIIPNNNLDLSYIHSIDWKARKVKIIDKKYYKDDDIQILREKIKNSLMGN